MEDGTIRGDAAAVLSACARQLRSGDEDSVAAALDALRDEALRGADTAFAAEHFARALAIDSERIRSALLCAAAQCGPVMARGPAATRIAAMLRRMLSTDELRGYALRCLCALGAPAVVRELAIDVWRAVDGGGAADVRRALHLFFGAYAAAPTAAGREALAQLCLRHLFAPEVLLSAVSILAELRYSVPDDYFAVVFMEFLTTDFVVFAKLVVFLQRCASQKAKSDIIANLVYHFQDYRFCLACVPLAREFPENDLLPDALWGAIMGFLQEEKVTCDVQYMLLEAAIQVKPSVRFDMEMVRILVNSINEDVRNVACTLQTDVELGFMILDSMIERFFENCNTGPLNVCMRYVLPRNEAFFNMLFKIYDLKTVAAVRFANEIAGTLRSGEEKEAFVKYGKKHFREIENDPFYIQFTDVLVSASKEPSDVRYLISQKITAFEREIQLHFISNVFLLWNNVGFVLQNNEKNVFYFLMNSRSREVRQSASELLNLFENKSLVKA